MAHNRDDRNCRQTPTEKLENSPSAEHEKYHPALRRTRFRVSKRCRDLR